MMTEQASFSLRNRNPDVLTCIANLSNDEVFTPPELANHMLDMLTEAWAKDQNGENIWENKDVKFLDPCTKSGVFLREITSRLTQGLEKKIPNIDKRVEHILSNQVYGIGITKLTSLLARRSVYCSKNADGEHSIAKNLKSKDGNIWYKNIEHRWDGSKCIFCGAARSVLDRDSTLSNYAYPFIHNENSKTQIKEMFGDNMEFDVIIGNPPYQLNDGGGTGSSAMPIYQKFIHQAKLLSPRYLTMIIPARWYSGGRGLDEFRNEMLNESRICELHDFIDAGQCFPNVEIKGGVCYFLWSRDYKGDCRIYSHDKENEISISVRPLLEPGAETFIRRNESIGILSKVKLLNEDSFSNIVSANDPFGFDVREDNSYKRVKPNFKLKKFENSVNFYYNGWQRDGIGFIDKDSITKNKNWVDRVKILIPKAWGTGNMNTDWLNPIITNSNSACTETYLVIGPFKSKIEAENVYSYIQTKFFHYVLGIIKNTQNTMKKSYSFIPMQDFNESWTDEKLFKKYKLSKNEIEIIESSIKKEIR